MVTPAGIARVPLLSRHVQRCNLNRSQGGAAEGFSASMKR